MSVELQRGPHIRVPEQRLHSLRICFSSHEEKRQAVPQVVRPEAHLLTGGQFAIVSGLSTTVYAECISDATFREPGKPPLSLSTMEPERLKEVV